jgi:hypothetical protein
LLRGHTRKCRAGSVGQPQRQRNHYAGENRAECEQDRPRDERDRKDLGRFNGLVPEPVGIEAREKHESDDQSTKDQDRGQQHTPSAAGRKLSSTGTRRVKRHP